MSISQIEEKRLDNLRSYSILDTLPEEDYENITNLAAQISCVPISLISFVDNHRQWFKSRHGLETPETSKDIAFCSHAITTPSQPLIVSDARIDTRFKDNPLVTSEPNIVFYAGFPLVSDKGYALGTLCVIDHKVRELTNSQIESLTALSKQVIRLLDLRKKSQQLEIANAELCHFARLAAHDLKGPLASITMTANKLKSELAPVLNTQHSSYVDMISNSSNKLADLIDTLLVYYTGDQFDKEQKTIVNLKELIHNIEDTLCLESNTSITLHSSHDDVSVNEAVLKQVLLNLFSNSIKYTDKEKVEIAVSVESKDNDGCFVNVSDNGMGIESRNLATIFEMFTTHNIKDRFGNIGTGIGLAAVKKMIEANGGTITAKSRIGVGSKFTFSLF